MTNILQIDFDNDGTFTSVGTCTRLRCSLGMRLYEVMPDESKLSATISNLSKDFMPENSSSPYYGNLVRGKRCRVVVNGTTIWTGFTESWKVTPSAYGRLEATLSARGIRQDLRDATPDIPLWTNTTFDVPIRWAITQVRTPASVSGVWTLDESELGIDTILAQESDYIDFETGVSVFEYIGDNAGQNANLWNFMQDCVLSEGGRFWFARDGKAMLKNRYYGLNSTPDFTVDDTYNEEPNYSTPQDEFLSTVEVTFYPRKLSATNTEILWELDAPIVFNASEVKTISVNLTESGAKKATGAQDIQTPSGADFVWSAGGGAIVVTSNGQTAELRITAPAFDSTLETLVLRGQTISSNNSAKVKAEQSGAAAANKRTATLNCKLISSITEAQGRADFELAKRYTTQGRVSAISFIGTHSSPPSQIAYTVGNLLNLVITGASHDRNYRIIAEEHELTSDGRYMLTFDLEPNHDTQYWILGQSVLGVNTRLMYG